MSIASGPPLSAEMVPGIGFRVARDFERMPPDIIQALSCFPTPDISDQMNRLYAMNSSIRPYSDPQLRLIGPACTVKVFPGDNLMVHKCLDVAKPGDVVVVDASSSTMNAVLGDTISMKARHRGIAGFVIDGLVRDVPAIRELGDFPVFARGVTPIGPLHRGPGELNYPISAGGIVVNPGDLIVADQNGVVVIPRESGGAILQSLRAKAETHEKYMEKVVKGEFSNAWVNDVFRSNGVIVE